MLRVWLVVGLLGVGCQFYSESGDTASSTCSVFSDCAEGWECVRGRCQSPASCPGGGVRCDSQCCRPTEQCCSFAEGYYDGCWPSSESCPGNGDDDDWGPECNPVSQTGCAAGQKCAMILDDPDSGAGHVGCMPDGTRGIGDTCIEPTVAGTADDCMAGGDCYSDTCHEICTTVNDQCSDGFCVTFADGNGNPIPVEICLYSCDPLTQNCPSDSDGCYIAGESVCVGAGTGLEGEECQFANGCSPGLVCTAFGKGTYVCRTMCGPWMDCFDGDGAVTSCGCGATAACDADEVCLPIDDGLGGAAHPEAGYCVPATDADCDCTASPICTPR